jgi:hypothetical protein
MKFRHITAGVLVAMSLGSAHAALPIVSSSLGTNPNAAHVAGFAMFGSASSVYSFNLSSLSTLNGSLFGFGNINVDSILVDSTSVSLGSGGTFSFAGLSAGAHTLTFNYSTPTIGGFGGSVTSVATPVPEIGSLAMAFVGVGVVGAAVRRRRLAHAG